MVRVMNRTITVVVKDLAGLRPMRSRLSSLLGAHGVDGDVGSDVQVATTELVTNGLTHANAPAVAVRATVDPDRVRLNVHHADRPGRRRAAASGVTTVTAASDVGGRGLGIVGLLSDEVLIDRARGHRTTALTFERRRPRADGAQSPLVQAIAGG